MEWLLEGIIDGKSQSIFLKTDFDRDCRRKFMVPVSPLKGVQPRDCKHQYKRDISFKKTFLYNI